MANPPIPDDVVIEIRNFKWNKGWENVKIFNHYGGKYGRRSISDCIYNRTFKHLPMPETCVNPVHFRASKEAREKAKAEFIEAPKPVCSEYGCTGCGEMFLGLHVAGKERLCDWCYDQYQIDKQDGLDIARRVADQRKKEREKAAYETLGHVKTWVYNELKDYNNERSSSV